MLLSYADFIATLRCPDCLESLVYHSTNKPNFLDGAYGVLTCRCYTYPVLGSIPILHKQPINVNSIGARHLEVKGPQPAELSKLLKEGEALEALLSLLALPLCPWPLNKVQLGRNLSQCEPFRSLGIRWRKERLKRNLRTRAPLSAEDWLTLFCWNSPTLFDAYNYLFFRFGQPRHLATLSLLSVLPPSDRPLLDLACGYGHILHYLTVRATPQKAVGLDYNFHQLWVAKHWIAPRAHFVCADADTPLPFKDGVFSAALCCDAFHYLSNQANCVQELERSTERGTLVFARVGNKGVAPSEGYERTPQGYADLLRGWKLRISSETSLVGSYLEARGPQLAASRAPEEVALEKWLYLIAAHDEKCFKDYGEVTTWPHATGVLNPNPIYDKRASGPRLELVFRFPSTWYAYENARMASYHAKKVTLNAQELKALQTQAAEQLEMLIKNFVLIGLPPNYTNDKRPWSFYANRALTHFISRFKRSP